MKTLLEALNRHLPFVRVRRNKSKYVWNGFREVRAYYHRIDKMIVLRRKTNVYIDDAFEFIHEIGHALFATLQIEEKYEVEELIIYRFAFLVFGFKSEIANKYLTEWYETQKKKCMNLPVLDFKRVIDASDALMAMPLAQDLNRLVRACADIGI